MVIDPAYVASWLIFFLLLGAIWYVLDRRFGISLYRWYFNLTREEPLAADQERGFIYNRSAKSRFSTAVVLCLLQSILVVSAAEVNPLVELLSFFFEVPVLMVGFYFGPSVYKLWRKKDAVLETVDRLESGELKLEDELKEATRHAAQTVRSALGIEDETEAGKSVAEGEQASKAAPVEPDPAEALNRYVGKN
jgi:hypothetical protein